MPTLTINFHERELEKYLQKPISSEELKVDNTTAAERENVNSHESFFPTTISFDEPDRVCQTSRYQADYK
jgi:hypothetical protein